VVQRGPSLRSEVGAEAVTLALIAIGLAIFEMLLPMPERHRG
jgi:hypothetical protein